jgi:PAS domain S-box-containing protein
MDGKILMVNSAAGEMFGMPEKDMPGRNVAEVMVPDHLRSQHEASMTRFVETGEKRIVGAGPVRLDAKRSDGSIFRAELSINTDTDLDGNPILIGFISDVSHIEVAEQKLKSARDEAQRLAEAKTMFLATMSHEMRTPLHGVIAALDLIEAKELSARDLNLVQIAQNCSERALRQINDVLDITRLGEGSEDNKPYRPLEMSREIVSELTPLATEKSSTLTLHVSGEGSEELYLGSPNAFSRAIYNLVGNAVKFTRRGHVDLFLDFLASENDGMVLSVRVRDDGPGIPPHDVKRIFQAFETGAPTDLKGPEGTGLGLPIAQRAVQRLGGTLSVSSAPGYGSEFSFDIPLKTAPRSAEPAPRKKEPIPSEMRTLDVLVVDDASVNIELMRETVERLGHNVTTASDGLEAVKEAAEHAFDVILMDINMPVMNGIDASRRIREGGLSRSAHIVAVTAISEPERRSEIFAAGLNSILVKPTRYADIAALLASLGTTDSERPEASANKAAPAAEAPEELVAGLEPLIGRVKAVDLIRRAFAEVPDDLLADTPDLPVTEALIDRLHMAAGVTGNVGFVTLSQELSRAERAARRGDAAKLAESRQRVSELVRNYKPDMEVL